MKYKLAAIAVAILYTSHADATTCSNGAKDYPKCTPSTTVAPATPAGSPVSVVASPQAYSGAIAGAQSGAVSGSSSESAATGTGTGTATVGPVSSASDLSASQIAQQRASASGGNATSSGGNGGAGGGGGSIADNSTSNSRALAIGLPPLVSLPPMAAVHCANATITQSSTGVLMGAFSRADAKTDSSDCTLIGMYNSMVERCLFSSAKMVQDLLVKKHLPGFQAEGVAYLKNDLDPGFVDYSPTQCAAMRNPPAQVAMIAPPAPAPAPVPAPTPAPEPGPRTVNLEADALFDFDKDELKQGGRSTLDALARTIIGEAANVVIVGHTDGIGSDRYNDGLSMRRANAVRAHLALAGVDLGRMVAIGKGKRQPIADNKTAEGRAQNRRVEVQITVPQASKRLERIVAGG